MLRMVAPAIIAMVVAANSSLAERVLVPLRQTIAASSLIVAGEVLSVSDQGAPAERATIDVRRTFLGTAPASLIVEGTPPDPEGHGFVAGQRLLLFLTTTPAPPAGATHRLVDGGGGVIGLTAATAQGAGDLVQAAIANGTVPFPVLRPYLAQGGTPAPAVLLAATFSDFQDSVPIGVDGRALVDLACGTVAAASPAIRRSAIALAGQLRLEEARQCLEALLGTRRRRRPTSPAGDPGARLAAARALGDLGGDESTPGLLNALVAEAKLLSSSCSGSLLAGEIALALGRLGEDGIRLNPKPIAKTAFRARTVSLASTAVHALGLIGDRKATSLLRRLGRRHRHPLIRAQALEAVARLGG